MKIFLKRLFCKHEWYLYRTIHGDERNYATQEHRLSCVVNIVIQAVVIMWNICHKSGRVLFTTNDERTAIKRDKYGWRVKKVDDRYEIAKQHGMAIEFVDW